MADFKRCGKDGCVNSALTLSGNCWEHIADKDSYTASIRKVFNDGGDLKGANLEKAVLKDINAAKVNLAFANLSQADLSGSHIFNASFECAYLLGTDLSGSDLTHCDFRGADMTKANLSGARLWNADLRNAALAEADISGADLWNANLHNVKIWHANFENAKSLTRRNFASDPHLLWTSKINEEGVLSAEEAYRGLKSHFLAKGIYDDAGWASFREKTMERLLMKKKKDLLRYIPSLIMSALCGYGEKPARIIAAALAAIFFYAATYGLLNAVESSGVRSYTMRVSDYIYYSTVTFTTVGYGDFVPKSNAFFRLLAASEAFMGAFLMGLFVFTLARKYSAR